MVTILKLITALFLLYPFVQADLASTYSYDIDSEPTTIIVVRHAEKVDNSTDPDLSEDGLDRAARLATMLQSMDIDGLFSTPFKRTRQTLGVIADKHGVTIQEYDPKNPNPVLDALKVDFGKTYLIAGHSNTAPHIVNYLSGNAVYTDLGDDVYDHLWIVHCYPDGTSKTVLLHY